MAVKKYGVNAQCHAGHLLQAVRLLGARGAGRRDLAAAHTQPAAQAVAEHQQLPKCAFSAHNPSYSVAQHESTKGDISAASCRSQLTTITHATSCQDEELS